MLYLTVLSMGGTMIAYLVAKQYSDPVISGIRAVCVVCKSIAQDAHVTSPHSHIANDSWTSSDIHQPPLDEKTRIDSLRSLVNLVTGVLPPTCGFGVLYQRRIRNGSYHLIIRRDGIE
jgi:hypothetical protein